MVFDFHTHIKIWTFHLTIICLFFFIITELNYFDDSNAWKTAAKETVTMFMHSQGPNGEEKLRNLMNIISSVDEIGMVRKQWIEELSNVFQQSRHHDENCKLLVEASQRAVDYEH